MSTGIARIIPTTGGTTDDRPPRTLAVAGTIVGLGIVALIVAIATTTGRGVEAAVAAVAAVGVLASFRWPLLPMFAIAVFIPFEEAINIEGLGTLSRYAEILFIVVYGIPRLGRLSFLAVPGAGWGLVAWAAFSSGWAIDSSAAWAEITPLILQLAVAVLIANAVIQRPSVVRPLLWAYSVAASGTALLALANVAISGGLGGPGARVTGLANQDPALFAAILVPALLFGFYELLYGNLLIPSAAVVLLSTLGIVVSGTRSAWLGVVVVFAILVIPRLEGRRRIISLAVIVAVIAIVIQIPGVTEFISQRTDTAISTGGAGRTDIWAIGLAIFATAPWIGVGIGNFPVANTADLAREALLPFQSGQGLENFAPHNIYVGTLVELGIIGFILLVAFLLPLVLRRGWGREGAVVQASLASLLVIGIFLDVLIRKEFWFFVGLASGLTYLAHHVRTSTDEPTTADP